MHARTIASMALGTTALLAVTACGPEAERASGASTPAATPSAALDTLPVDQILAKSGAAMDALQSVHVTGTLSNTVDGKTADGTPVAAGTSVKMDLTIDKKGNCRGTVHVAGTGSLSIIKTAELVHVNGDAEFWRSIAAQKKASKKQENAVVGAFAAHWVRIPTSNPQARQMTAACETPLTSVGANAVKAKESGTSVIDGRAVVAVSAETAQGQKETYWIATEGTPHLLKALVGGETAGEIAYSAFDTPIDTTPPADSEVIDIAKLTPAGAGS
ncbi:hypothetical protein [Streptomyces sp. NBC_00347]|uniref:hypothetical protein n=1 Tax=Streptomyces sp. NBC_00347 TaxID=2975721 RepID=UPI002257519C|nr:hypothetical protein [Streptomyces sp. NBC_00347]MCX5129313.1 hypothetical protein [Streptomyces sp. NBC_00347]